MIKKQIISKIINQVNSLNKKIKTFKAEGVTDHLDFVTSMFNDKQMEYKKDDNGNIISLSKSAVNFYGKQNILQLKRTLSVLKKLNNHDTFGTINKYKKVQSESWDTLQDTCKNHLRNKGYAEADIQLIVSSKKYIDALTIAFKDLGRGFGSLQIIEKVFLDFNQSNMNQDDISKAMSDIEYSFKVEKKITDTKRAFARFLESEENRRGGR